MTDLILTRCGLNEMPEEFGRIYDISNAAADATKARKRSVLCIG